MNLPESKLTESQFITRSKVIGKKKLVVKIRHDDECGNGHNTFAITTDLYIGRRLDSCGMMHDEVKRFFPELESYLKWHLCSTDGPLHYIANTLYWIEQGTIEYARSSAIWPDANPEDFTEEKLHARLPKLMEEFKAAVESLGLEY